jgi:ABC-type uncharacterized transport system ATPase subunit
MIGGARAAHHTAGRAERQCVALRHVTVAPGVVAIIGVAGNGQTELATMLRDTILDARRRSSRKIVRATA